ncbi:hypothetical protein M8C21_004116 [Ambrosia artemisiifolia]|uniref:Cytochrome b5 heme-binding domain-containing protein n=1 Tax=Ambrosia artemisiifolia TaxID=4212 RepID=A0AAD5CN55_AMBAR|nr:hypothetical protein M8C21_004116 [Ambrosia artemisiifolia]
MRDLVILTLEAKSVYDVTNFLEDHPGGDDVLLSATGKKISEVEGLHRHLKLNVLDLRFNKLSTTKSLGQLAANRRWLSETFPPLRTCLANVGQRTCLWCVFDRPLKVLGVTMNAVLFVFFNPNLLLIHKLLLPQRKLLMERVFPGSCSYLIPELGPCSLQITYSAHTDLSVKFQSHYSRDDEGHFQHKPL